MTNAELIAWQNRVQSPIEKALRRAYQLGQTYWQQADSESYSQNKKSDDTAAKFEALVAEMIATPPTPETAKIDWQQRALEHGFKYWRAPDAHGVTATQEQALNLLRDLLGVEVDVEGAIPLGKAIDTVAFHGGSVEIEAALRRLAVEPLAPTPEAEPAQQDTREPWALYLSDRADGVKGHYAIARWNPAGYREVWNLRSHKWSSFSDEVLTLDEAHALLKTATLATPPAEKQAAPTWTPEQVQQVEKEAESMLGKLQASPQAPSGEDK